MTEQLKPKWFTAVAIVALLWNLMGVLAFVMQIMMPAEALAELPEAQRALYQNIPFWATAAFAIAVFAGCLGCVLLLLEKALATPVFALSLVAIVVQDIHGLLLTDSIAVLGSQAVIMPACVALIAVALLLWSRHSVQKAWLK